MLSKKLEAALNKQINEEYYSSYIYLAMAAYLEDANLDGCAHWMRMQAQEEVEHAMRFYDFLIERGGRVELHEIDKPPFEFGSPLEIMEQSLDHERFVTSRINGLYDLAFEEQDRPAQVMLQWFITEQVEEEATVSESRAKRDAMVDQLVGNPEFIVQALGEFSLDLAVVTEPLDPPQLHDLIHRARGRTGRAGRSGSRTIPGCAIASALIAGSSPGFATRAARGSCRPRPRPSARGCARSCRARCSRR